MAGKKKRKQKPLTAAEARQCVDELSNALADTSLALRKTKEDLARAEDGRLSLSKAYAEEQMHRKNVEQVLEDTRKAYHLAAQDRAEKSQRLVDCEGKLLEFETERPRLTIYRGFKTLILRILSRIVSCFA